MCLLARLLPPSLPSCSCPPARDGRRYSQGRFALRLHSHWTRRSRREPTNRSKVPLSAQLRQGLGSARTLRFSARLSGLRMSSNIREFERSSIFEFSSTTFLVQLSRISTKLLYFRRKWHFEGQFSSLQVNIANEMPQGSNISLHYYSHQYMKISYGFGNSIPFVTLRSGIRSSIESNSVE